MNINNEQIFPLLKPSHTISLRSPPLQVVTMLLWSSTRNAGIAVVLFTIYLQCVSGVKLSWVATSYNVYVALVLVRNL